MKYPKLNNDDKCAYPEREICNFDRDKGIGRCEYMKYDNSQSILSQFRWKCIYKEV